MDQEKTPLPEHVLPSYSPRGFARFEEIDGVDSDRVRVHEASNTDGPHVWITAKELGGDHAQVELSAEAAWRFAEQIMVAVASHYQGDSRPDDRVADLARELPRRQL